VSGPETLLLGTAMPVVAELADALEAELVAVPVPALPAEGALGWSWAEELDRWRAAHVDGARVARIVVAPWAADVAWAPLDEVDLDGWLTQCEVPLARWWAALGVAARRCADGGAIVAVVEAPPPIDSAGWGPAAAVAEAAENMARSLAHAEGPRRVRSNTVTTPLRLQHPPLVDPRPPLATFPGTIGHEVAGAVRLLLGGDAAGVTASTVHADSGRWMR
jgi:NAD(P)-dependent dehydrogenase (short-subunit alcohol dehydrogenase family)